MIASMGKRQSKLSRAFIAGSLVLVLGGGTWPAAAQQRSLDESQARIPPPGSLDQAQDQDQGQAAPPPAPRQPDAQPMQGPPPQDQPMQDRNDQPTASPQGQGQPDQATPPDSLTLPAGTVIRVRVDDWVSSDRNVIGDNFSATLDQPVVVDGWVVARRGQSQTGRVSLVKKGHGGESSQLGLDLPELTLVDGQQLALQTQLSQMSAGTDRGRDVAVVGSTTVLGTVIGAIAGRGVGAAIGAGVGATAGIIGVMSTPGRPTVVSPETVLSFRLQQAVTISTGRGQFAFQPVSQSDYDSRSPQGRQRLARPGPPPPPYYPGPYPYPYAYAYPYPYGYYPAPYVGFGYYGRYGYWRR